jgi:flavin reductase (DIM6/NTAB) family NADH-FMN oxidoreductase RutF
VPLFVPPLAHCRVLAYHAVAREATRPTQPLRHRLQLRKLCLDPRKRVVEISPQQEWKAGKTNPLSKESPMKKTTFPLSEVYRLLEPGPVVLVTTARKGRANIMPMSWHTMMEFEPPLVGCVLSNRNYSFETLRKTKECVINIPTVELAKTVVACGNVSGRRVDKFAAFGLTPVAAACVQAPLIAECYASLECQVRDGKLVARYNFFVLEVVHAWISASRKRPRTIHHQGEGEFMVAGRTISLPSKITARGGE